MWNRFSIKVQLIIVITFIVTVVELSTLFFIYNLQQKESLTSANLQAETLVKSIHNDIIRYFLNPQADMLSDLSYRLSAFKDISSFVAYNEERKAMFEYGNTKELLSIQKSIENEKTFLSKKHLYVKKNIEAEGYIFGYVLMGVSLATYKSKQAEITTIFLIILPLALFLGFLLSLFLSKNFTEPLSQILKAMKEGDPTKEAVHINTSAKNEIKELFDGFNKQMSLIHLSSEEIQTLNQEIEETQREVVFTMGAIGETRSKETGNHVKRVALYSKVFALQYGLSEEDAEMLKQASPMHDIGKVGIPDNILNKPGRFTPEERVIMDTHAELGYNMLKASNKPLLKLAATVAYEHHEKWDGSGYPNALKGEEISISGRITAIADVFDALGSDRVYKKAWDDERIFTLFREERGKHFDPRLIDIFFTHIEIFLAIREDLKDVYAEAM